MPRYFFDVHDGVEVLDREGIELMDPATARAHAMQMAAGYAINPDMMKADGGAMVVDVRDQSERLFTVRLVFNIEVG